MADGEDVQQVHHAGKDRGGGIGVSEGAPAGAARPGRRAAYPKPLPDITNPALVLPRHFRRNGGDISLRHGETITDRARVMKRVLLVTSCMLLAAPALADTGWPHYG